MYSYLTIKLVLDRVKSRVSTDMCDWLGIPRALSIFLMKQSAIIMFIGRGSEIQTKAPYQIKGNFRNSFHLDSYLLGEFKARNAKKIFFDFHPIAFRLFCKKILRGVWEH